MADKGKQAQLNEDDIIRRKLLIDGEGVGDDRRIMIALKQFVKWCLTDDNADESQLAHERILLSLFGSELAMAKSEQMLRMNSIEMENYEKLCLKMDKSIEEAQQRLIECKSELVNAKKVRKNKCEYDAMASVIFEHEDRRETMNKLSSLNDEINRLEKTRGEMEKKLERRKKQFQVLLCSAYELQQMLNEEETFEKEAEEMQAEADVSLGEPMVM